jgi:hypothetical protein
MVKRLIMMAAFVLLAMGAYAQVTISGGFALSTTEEASMSGDISDSGGVDAEIGLGANIYADYLLPISIPLSLGFEIGVDGSKFRVYDKFDEKVTAIPLLLRAAYHFDLFPKLDLYGVLKIGYAIGIWTGEFKDMLINRYNATIDAMGGFAWGIDAGASYYITQTVGIFAEIGFDDYMLKAKGTGSDRGYSGSATFKVPFNRFLTAGVSVKF